MGGNGNKEEVDPKWDACVDLTLRRFLYSSLGGAFGALLFFRQSPSPSLSLSPFSVRFKIYYIINNSYINILMNPHHTDYSYYNCLPTEMIVIVMD